MKASVVEHATARRRARDLYTPDIELTLAKANLGSFCSIARKQNLTERIDCFFDFIFLESSLDCHSIGSRRREGRVVAIGLRGQLRGVLRIRKILAPNPEIPERINGGKFNLSIQK